MLYNNSLVVLLMMMNSIFGDEKMKARFEYEGKQDKNSKVKVENVVIKPEKLRTNLKDINSIETFDTLEDNIEEIFEEIGTKISELVNINLTDLNVLLFETYKDTTMESLEKYHKSTELMRVISRIAKMIFYKKIGQPSYIFDKIRLFIEDKPDDMCIKFYNEVIIAVNTQNEIADTEDPVNGIGSKLESYSLKRLLTNLVFDCSSNYNYLDSFVENPDLLITNLARYHINNETKYRFVFYDIIHNYVNNSKHNGTEKILFRSDEIKQITELILKLYKICNNDAYNKTGDVTNIRFRLELKGGNINEKDKYGLINKIMESYQMEKALNDEKITNPQANTEKILEASIHPKNLDLEQYKGISRIVVNNPEFSSLMRLTQNIKSQPQYMNMCSEFLGIKYCMTEDYRIDEGKWIKVPNDFSHLLQESDHLGLVYFWLYTLCNSPEITPSWEVKLPFSENIINLRYFYGNNFYREVIDRFVSRTGPFKEFISYYAIYEMGIAFKGKDFDTIVDFVISSFFAEDARIYLHGIIDKLKGVHSRRTEQRTKDDGIFRDTNERENSITAKNARSSSPVNGRSKFSRVRERARFSD